MFVSQFRTGEKWKRLRSALDKAATPRNIQSYTPAINKVFQKFIAYLRRSRNDAGFVDDIDQPLKMLLMEGKWNWHLHVVRLAQAHSIYLYL